MTKTKEFPVDYRESDLRTESVKAIVPLIMDLINPASVVDIGCNLGYWLQVFKENGVQDILGLDGPWVNTQMLLIPQSSFRGVDLNAPISLERKFDMVVCLEVAEHLLPERSSGFVTELTRLGKAVLFSGAIPNQGGRNHFTEKWPDYWIDEFAKNGFEVVDCIRPVFWGNSTVYYYYSQNTFLFVSREFLRSNKKLQDIKKLYDVIPRALVHPAMFARKMEKFQDRTFPGIITKFLKRIFSKDAKLKARFDLPPSARARV